MRLSIHSGIEVKSNVKIKFKNKRWHNRHLFPISTTAVIISEGMID